MNLLSDLGKFLETRLEEFLQSNPNLELQYLLEQLREQEQKTLKLITEKYEEKKDLEIKIISLAEEVKVWHGRILKAKLAKRLDLSKAAQEREILLIQQGNQLWEEMEKAKQKIIQGKALLNQIMKRRQEIQAKTIEFKASEANSDYFINTEKQNIKENNFQKTSDSLEADFQLWELDNEMEELKRNI
ncbi:TIGR04376 family protein [Candidatus Atelocyanobacterium thalassae]|uniref:TIGR04376 family protein n=1 Tax=cyanobacterium endosymbiont of Braarudosphaera bigelowii TaxID=1285375 RepID=A0ABN6K222_9CHRO|nr:TIGR04376 family protein [Candidatus Atelocyanobacterium thalassa]BDA39305.1 hypothetical protein CPARK_000014400 [cyanobacterium endosymbiont of Braarudosphaera bigelowii]